MMVTRTSGLATVAQSGNMCRSSMRYVLYPSRAELSSCLFTDGMYVKLMESRARRVSTASTSWVRRRLVLTCEHICFIGKWEWEY